MTTDQTPIRTRRRRSALGGARSRRGAGTPCREPRDAGRVRYLHGEVKLAEPALELRRARAQALRGDRTWRERLQRYERGDTLIVELTAWVLVGGGAGSPPEHRSCYCREAVWIDRSTSLRVLSERLRALVLRAFVTVAPGLRDRGIGLAASGAEVAVELDIDRTVIAALTAQLDDAAASGTVAGIRPDSGR